MFVVLQVRGGDLLDGFLRRLWLPFCWTACRWSMLRELESGLAALRLASPSRGMTALWCSLWLSLLLPLCVAPARVPTAQHTGRIQHQSQAYLDYTVPYSSVQTSRATPHFCIFCQEKRQVGAAVLLCPNISRNKVYEVKNKL